MNREEMLARLKKGEDPLELSIEKWQDIVDGKGEELGEDNCALCQVSKVICSDCPVFKKTKQEACCGTPYSDFTSTYEEDERKKLAKKELAFLKSLRKETKQ